MKTLKLENGVVVNDVLEIRRWKHDGSLVYITKGHYKLGHYSNSYNPASGAICEITDAWKERFTDLVERFGSEVSSHVAGSFAVKR